MKKYKKAKNKKLQRELSFGEKVVIDLTLEGFPKKYEEGFTLREIDEIKKQFPEILESSFNNALTSITCTKIDGELVIYPTDLYNALVCGLEHREVAPDELD